MKYVLFYESGNDLATKGPIHFPAHRARWKEFQERGTLLMIGPFSDRSGALGVFTSHEAAEDFAKGDPFVLNEVISKWHIREWNEALAGP